MVPGLARSVGSRLLPHDASRSRGTSTVSVAAVCILACAPAVAAATDMQAPDTNRQALDAAWWTGPLLAASPGTLPRGHFLIEPYVYDAISYARYDANGDRHNTSDTHSLGSQTYLLYGLVDKVSIGAIPRFGFNDVSDGRDSSGIRVGDLTFQAQYRIAQFREGGAVPTTSLVLQVTLPTGKYDRLGDRPSDGMGSGAYSATLALYSQYFFWMPNGRILRARLNVSHTFSDTAEVSDVSVYGTDAGFRGRAAPGDSSSIIVAGEYSLTRNWVLALDLLYQYDDATRVSGRSTQVDNGIMRDMQVERMFSASRRFGIAPAVEYNFNSRVGIIVGARWFLAGRNADASITPVAAINMVY